MLIKTSKEKPSSPESIELSKCSLDVLEQKLNDFDRQSYEKWDLGNWVELLDRFDGILADAVASHAVFKLGNPSASDTTTPSDSDSDQQRLSTAALATTFPTSLVRSVLSFTSFLLDSCRNKHMYNSYEHLLALLWSPDASIVCAALRTLLSSVRRGSFPSPRIASASSTLPAAHAAAFSAALLAVAHGGSTALHPPHALCSGVQQQQQLVPADVQSLVGLISKEGSIAPLVQQSVGMSGTERFALWTRVRLVSSSSACSDVEEEEGTLTEKEAEKGGRGGQRWQRGMGWTHARLLAVTVLGYSMNHDQLTVFHSLNPTFVSECTTLLRPTSTAPLAVQECCLQSLACLSTDKTRLLAVSQSLGLGSYHGIISTLARSLLTADHASSAEHTDFAVSIVSMLFTLSSYAHGANQTLSSGVFSTLLSLLRAYYHSEQTEEGGSGSSGDAPAVRPHPRVVSSALVVLDQVMSGRPAISQHLVEAGIAHIIVGVIDHDTVWLQKHLETKAAAALQQEKEKQEKEAEGSAGKAPATTAEPQQQQQAKPTKMPHAMRRLLTAALKSLVTCIVSQGGAQIRVRDLLQAEPQQSHQPHQPQQAQAPLAASLKHIFAERAAYGATIVQSACQVLTALIHNEPSALSLIHASGIIEAALAALPCIPTDVPEALPVISSTLGSICLNEQGTALVRDRRVIPLIVTAIEQAAHTLNPEAVCSFALDMNDLLRSHADVRAQAMESLLAALDSTAALLSANSVSSNAAEKKLTPDQLALHANTVLRLAEGFVQPSHEMQRSFLDKQGAQKLIAIMTKRFRALQPLSTSRGGSSGTGGVSVVTAGTLLRSFLASSNGPVVRALSESVWKAARAVCDNEPLMSKIGTPGETFSEEELDAMFELSQVVNVLGLAFASGTTSVMWEWYKACTASQSSASALCVPPTDILTAIASVDARARVRLFIDRSTAKRAAANSSSTSAATSATPSATNDAMMMTSEDGALSPLVSMSIDSQQQDSSQLSPTAVDSPVLGLAPTQPTQQANGSGSASSSSVVGKKGSDAAVHDLCVAATMLFEGIGRAMWNVNKRFERDRERGAAAVSSTDICRQYVLGSAQLAHCTRVAAEGALRDIRARLESAKSHEEREIVELAYDCLVESLFHSLLVSCYDDRRHQANTALLYFLSSQPNAKQQQQQSQEPILSTLLALFAERLGMAMQRQCASKESSASTTEQPSEPAPSVAEQQQQQQQQQQAEGTAPSVSAVTVTAEKKEDNSNKKIGTMFPQTSKFLQRLACPALVTASTLNPPRGAVTDRLVPPNTAAALPFVSQFTSFDAGRLSKALSLCAARCVERIWAEPALVKLASLVTAEQQQQQQQGAKPYSGINVDPLLISLLSVLAQTLAAVAAPPAPPAAEGGESKEQPAARTAGSTLRDIMMSMGGSDALESGRSFSEMLGLSRGGATRAEFAPDPSVVRMLGEMGFTEGHATAALRAVRRNDVNAAMDWLLTHPDDSAFLTGGDSSSAPPPPATPAAPAGGSSSGNGGQVPEQSTPMPMETPAQPQQPVEATPVPSTAAPTSDLLGAAINAALSTVLPPPSAPLVTADALRAVAGDLFGGILLQQDDEEEEADQQMGDEELTEEELMARAIAMSLASVPVVDLLPPPPQTPFTPMAPQQAQAPLGPNPFSISFGGHFAQPQPAAAQPAQQQSHVTPPVLGFGPNPFAQPPNAPMAPSQPLPMPTTAQQPQQSSPPGSAMGYSLAPAPTPMPVVDLSAALAATTPAAPTSTATAPSARLRTTSKKTPAPLSLGGEKESSKKRGEEDKAAAAAETAELQGYYQRFTEKAIDWCLDVLAARPILVFPVADILCQLCRDTPSASNGSTSASTISPRVRVLSALFTRTIQSTAHRVGGEKSAAAAVSSTLSTAESEEALLRVLSVMCRADPMCCLAFTKGVSVMADRERQQESQQKQQASTDKKSEKAPADQQQQGGEASSPSTVTMPDVAQHMLAVLRAAIADVDAVPSSVVAATLGLFDTVLSATFSPQMTADDRTRIVELLRNSGSQSQPQQSQFNARPECLADSDVSRLTECCIALLASPRLQSNQQNQQQQVERRVLSTLALHVLATTTLRHDLTAHLLMASSDRSAVTAIVQCASAVPLEGPPSSAASRGSGGAAAAAAVSGDGMALAVLRHVCEDPATLQAVMEQEIKKEIQRLAMAQADPRSPLGAQQQQQGVLLKHFVRATSNMIARDPTTFAKAVAATCVLKKSTSGRTAGSVLVCVKQQHADHQQKERAAPPAALCDVVSVLVDTLSKATSAEDGTSMMAVEGKEALDIAAAKKAASAASATTCVRVLASLAVTFPAHVASLLVKHQGFVGSVLRQCIGRSQEASGRQMAADATHLLCTLHHSFPSSKLAARILSETFALLSEVSGSTNKVDIGLAHGLTDCVTSLFSKATAATAVPTLTVGGTATPAPKAFSNALCAVLGRLDIESHPLQSQEATALVTSIIRALDVLVRAASAPTTAPPATAKQPAASSSQQQQQQQQGGRRQRRNRNRQSAEGTTSSAQQHEGEGNQQQQQQPEQQQTGESATTVSPPPPPPAVDQPPQQQQQQEEEALNASGLSATELDLNAFDDSALLTDAHMLDEVEDAVAADLSMDEHEHEHGEHEHEHEHEEGDLSMMEDDEEDENEDEEEDSLLDEEEEAEGDAAPVAPAAEGEGEMEAEHDHEEGGSEDEEEEDEEDEEGEGDEEEDDGFDVNEPNLADASFLDSAGSAWAMDAVGGQPALPPGVSIRQGLGGPVYELSIPRSLANSSVELQELLGSGPPSSDPETLRRIMRLTGVDMGALPAPLRNALGITDASGGPSAAGGGGTVAPYVVPPFGQPPVPPPIAYSATPSSAASPLLTTAATMLVPPQQSQQQTQQQVVAPCVGLSASENGTSGYEPVCIAAAPRGAAGSAADRRRRDREDPFESAIQRGLFGGLFGERSREQPNGALPPVVAEGIERALEELLPRDSPSPQPPAPTSTSTSTSTDQQPSSSSATQTAPTTTTTMEVEGQQQQQAAVSEAVVPAQAPAEPATATPTATAATTTTQQEGQQANAPESSGESASATAPPAEPQVQPTEASPVPPAPSMVADLAGMHDHHGGLDPLFLAELPEDIREEIIRAEQQRGQLAGTLSPSSNISPEFLAALPPDIQAEVLQEEALRQARARGQQQQRQTAAAPTAPTPTATTTAATTEQQQQQEAVAPPAPPPPVSGGGEASSAAPTAPSQSSEGSEQAVAPPPTATSTEAPAQQQQQQQQQQAPPTAAAGGSSSTGAQPAPQAPDAGYDAAAFIATLAPELRQEALLQLDDQTIATLPAELAAEARALRDRVPVQSWRATPSRRSGTRPSMGGVSPSSLVSPHASADERLQAVLNLHQQQPQDSTATITQQPLLEPSSVTSLLSVVYLAQLLARAPMQRTMSAVCATHADTRTAVARFLVGVLRHPTFGKSYQTVQRAMDLMLHLAKSSSDFTSALSATTQRPALSEKAPAGSVESESLWKDVVMAVAGMPDDLVDSALSVLEIIVKAPASEERVLANVCREHVKAVACVLSRDSLPDSAAAPCTSVLRCMVDLPLRFEALVAQAKERRDKEVAKRVEEAKERAKKDKESAAPKEGGSTETTTEATTTTMEDGAVGEIAIDDSDLPPVPPQLPPYACGSLPETVLSEVAAIATCEAERIAPALLARAKALEGGGDQASGSGSGSGDEWAGAQEAKLSRVVKAYCTLINTFRSASGTPHSEACTPAIYIAPLEELWDAVDAYMRAADCEQSTTTATSTTTERDGKAPASSASAALPGAAAPVAVALMGHQQNQRASMSIPTAVTARALPLLESYIAFHSLPDVAIASNQAATQLQDIDMVQHSTTAALLAPHTAMTPQTTAPPQQQQPAASSASAGGSSTSTSATATATGKKPVSKRLFRFLEQNRRLVNAVLRDQPQLLEGELGSAVMRQPLARTIEFDNKRKWLRYMLRARARDEFGGGGVSVTVRRSHIFEDSYFALRAHAPADLRGHLSVRFEGEEGIDAGGVSREWFLVLSREMFNANYALFTRSGDQKYTYQPNPMSYINPNHLEYFQFTGRVIALAIQQGQLLDAYFTRSFYKHILGIPVSYQDMEAMDMAYYKNLKWMLENSIEGVLDLTFTAETNEFGVPKVVELKQGGTLVAVTDDNKVEYVRLITELRMTTAIRAQIRAFLLGFHDIIPHDLISVFNENELELLVCGLPEVDVEDLRANTEYHGYTASSPQIQWFWQAVDSFNQEQRARLLQFVTGTSKVPVDGFRSLMASSGVQRFNIHKVQGHEHRLPTAHTCFNQLDLPEYTSYEQLLERLTLAVSEGSEGFGFA